MRRDSSLHFLVSFYRGDLHLQRRRRRNSSIFFFFSVSNTTGDPTTFLVQSSFPPHLSMKSFGFWISLIIEEDHLEKKSNRIDEQIISFVFPWSTQFSLFSSSMTIFCKWFDWSVILSDPEWEHFSSIFFYWRMNRRFSICFFIDPKMKIDCSRNLFSPIWRKIPIESMEFRVSPDDNTRKPFTESIEFTFEICSLFFLMWMEMEWMFLFRLSSMNVRITEGRQNGCVHHANKTWSTWKILSDAKYRFDQLQWRILLSGKPFYLKISIPTDILFPLDLEKRISLLFIVLIIDHLDDNSSLFLDFYWSQMKSSSANFFLFD